MCKKCKTLQDELNQVRETLKATQLQRDRLLYAVGDAAKRSDLGIALKVADEIISLGELKNSIAKSLADLQGAKAILIGRAKHEMA